MTHSEKCWRATPSDVRSACGDAAEQHVETTHPDLCGKAKETAIMALAGRMKQACGTLAVGPSTAPKLSKAELVDKLLKWAAE